jgi:hypothetical protein
MFNHSHTQRQYLVVSLVVAILIKGQQWVSSSVWSIKKAAWARAR